MGPNLEALACARGWPPRGMSSAQRRECPRPTLPPRALPPPSGPHRTPTSAMDWRVRPDNITTAADFWALWDADQDAFAAIGLTLGAERSGGASICSIVRRPRPPLPPPPCLSPRPPGDRSPCLTQSLPSRSSHGTLLRPWMTRCVLCSTYARYEKGATDSSACSVCRST